MSNDTFAVARYVGEENLVNASCIRSLHCSKGGACELLRRCVRGESTVLTAIDERESGFTIQLRSEDGKTSGPSIFESAKREWASPRPTASDLTMTGCWWYIFKAIIRPCDGASGQRPPCERPSTIRNCYTVIDVLGTQEDKHLRRETPNNYMGNARWICCSPTASRSSRGLDPNASMHRQRQDSIGCRDDGARKYSSSIGQWRAKGPGGGGGESLE